jgi:L-alanine-DL-glutamate epimerase-like enolase superfamily enzyme
MSSYPGIFQPFGGFADGIPVRDGYVTLPEIPGVGFEAKAELYNVMKTLVENYKQLYLMELVV